MIKLGNYVNGQWREGEGEGKAVFDAVTGEVIAHATTKGIDLGTVLAYGREKGGELLDQLPGQQLALDGA